MKKSLSIVLCLMFVALLFGCETIPTEHRGAAVGAGVGAATGTAAGAVFGDGTRSAVIGGLLGGLVGGVIGHYGYDQRRSRDETVQTYNYQPGQGTVLTVEEASATPQTVRPGESVDLQMTYAVLTPSPEAESTITEIREITRNGETVGNPQVNVARRDGTYTTTVPLRLPPNAQRGTYNVRNIVQSQGVSDVRETTFTVQ